MKWKNDPFIILEDDVLSKAEVEKIVKIIGEKTDNNRIDNEYMHYNRFSIDKEPRILAIVEQALYQRKFWEKAIGTPDMAWCCHLPRYEANVTAYTDGDEYVWHSDHLGSHAGTESDGSRALTFIFYLIDKGFTGGHTELSLNCGYNYIPKVGVTETWKSIEPKAGRLLLFPSYILHRVTPLTLKNKDAPFIERRLTINGHMKFELPVT